MTNPFDALTLGPLTIPVPNETVGLIRLPVSIDGITSWVKTLTREFGDDLVILTDTGIEGWIVIARPETHDSGPASGN